MALTPSELFTKVSPSVWGVRTYDKDGLPLATGSAVVIANETLVTNCHVLSKSSRFVVTRDNMSLGGTLDMWDTERDLCQIKARNLNALPVKLAGASSLMVGQNVYALGNPKGLELTLSAGLISSLRRDDKEQLVLIQTSAPVSMGSSGGGLFDDQGRLIGLTTLSAKDGQNLNFAIPSDWIRDVPARHKAALQKKEVEKTVVSAAANSTGAVSAAGKVWRYEYRDIYHKRKQITVTARETGKDSLSEEATIDAIDVGSLQWTPSSPFMRFRSGSGVEWVEISPFVFMESMANQHRGTQEISAFGEKFQVTLRSVGDETVSVPAGTFATTKFNILGVRKGVVPTSGSPSLIGVNNIRATVWYSKELARVVKVSFFSSGTDVSKPLDKYDIYMTGKAM